MLLPRYLRVSPVPSSSSSSSAAAAVSALQQKLGEDHAGLVQAVVWMRAATFVCVPGYVAINELEPMALGLFPLDIASACSANALGFAAAAAAAAASSSSSSSRPATALDLCCCPGGKFQCILDGIGTDALVVGVDVSQPRLDVCKSLLDKKARFLCEQHGSEDNDRAPSPWRARHVLFRCDGTQFGTTSLGALVFDSSVQHEEITALFRQHRDLVQRRTTASSSHRRRRGSSGKGPGCGEDEELTVGDGNGGDDGDDDDSWWGPGAVDQDASSVGGVSMGSSFASGLNSTAATFPVAHSSGNGCAVIGTLRKRKNKSARQREEKRLKRIEHETLGALLASFDPRPPRDREQVAPASGAASGPDLRHYFDYVLVDAECSHDGSYRHMRYVAPQSPAPAAPAAATTTIVGEGQQPAVGAPERLQKPGAAASYLGPDRSSAAIVQLQRRLLANGFRLLRPSTVSDVGSGSALVYSTCSLEEDQNEGVVRWFLEENSDAELVPLSAEDIFGAAAGPAEGATVGSCALSDREGADLERALQLLRCPVRGDDLVCVPTPSAFTPAADEEHLPVTTQHLRHYSRLLCRHIANLTRPPYVSPASAHAPSASLLPGTVRLSKEHGTSGLFIAKFRKKCDLI